MKVTLAIMTYDCYAAVFLLSTSVQKFHLDKQNLSKNILKYLHHILLSFLLDFS